MNITHSRVICAIGESVAEINEKVEGYYTISDGGLTLTYTFPDGREDKNEFPHLDAVIRFLDKEMEVLGFKP